MTGLITTNGNFINAELSAYAVPTYLGVGCGSGTTSVTDVALFNEVEANGYSRPQFNVNASGSTAYFTATFTSPGSYDMTNIGLIYFDANTQTQGYLTSEISSTSQSYIEVSGSPYFTTGDNIQVVTEVMTIASGDQYGLYVLRGQNGSLPLAQCAANTAVTQAEPGLFAKVDFPEVPIALNDMIEFTIEVEYQ